MMSNFHNVGKYIRRQRQLEPTPKNKEEKRVEEGKVIDVHYVVRRVTTEEGPPRPPSLEVIDPTQEYWRRTMNDVEILGYYRGRA